MAGSVRERGKGRWQIRAYAGHDPVSGKPSYRSRTVSADSKREAEKLAALLVAEVASGKNVGTTDMTIGELIDEWLEFRRPDLSPTTITAYEANFRNDLRPVLGAIKLAKLTVMDVDRLYASMARRVGPSMVRRAHVVLRGALAQAQKWGLVAVNVAADADLPRLRRPDTRPPHLEELQRILDAAPDDFRTLLRLAATSGARRGELCALRWSDLDLDAGRMSVHASVVEHDGQLDIKPPKTERRRVVVLDDSTTAVLRDHRSRCAAAARACSVTLPGSAFVFSPRPGNAEPYHPMSITRRFARTCERLGIDGIRFHDLRHMVASRLLAEGIDLQSVADRLGHSRASITLGTYTHSLGTNDQRAADAIGQVVAGISPS
jgi:integrase